MHEHGPACVLVLDRAGEGDASDRKHEDQRHEDEQVLEGQLHVQPCLLPHHRFSLRVQRHVNIQHTDFPRN